LYPSFVQVSALQALVPVSPVMSLLASTRVTSGPASTGTNVLLPPVPPHAAASMAPPNSAPNTNAQAFIASPFDPGSRMAPV
jgi:hypothetical protein